MCLFMVTLLSAAAAPGQSAVPADVAEVEKAVLDYRRAIQPGHVVLTEKQELNGVPDPQRDRTTKVWFDGKQIRADIMLRYKKDEAFHREVNCRNCEFDGYYVLLLEEKLDNKPVALALHPMGDNVSPDSSYAVLDPRLLGMVVDNSANLALARSRLDSYVGAPGREQVSIRRELWKGMDSQRIDYRFPPASAVREWVVPAWGPSVGRIEVEADVNGHHHHDWVESEYQQVGKAGVWFPRICTHESWTDGKLTDREVVDVEVLSLNEPLPADTFRLAGMNIPVGWPVTGFREEGMSTWDGKKVVPQTPSALPKPLPPSTIRGWLYAVSAVTLAVIAAMAIWRSFRKRDPETPPPG
jgi:hypothetical protein